MAIGLVKAAFMILQWTNVDKKIFLNIDHIYFAINVEDFPSFR